MQRLSTIAASLAAVAAGWMLSSAAFSCGAGQLTVEEAEQGLAASCVVLAHAMTKEAPEALDAVVARVCAPGRTRAFIARVISEHRPPNPEWLDEFGGIGAATPPKLHPESDAGLP